MGDCMYYVELNRERFRNHLQYDWWKYLVGILATLFLWNMITTMTRPRTPADKKIEIFLVGEYILDDSSESIADNILEDFPNLLEVNINNIPIGGDPQMDYVGRQKLMVMLGSQTGDIYAFEKGEFEQFAKQGAFLPLDDFIEQNKHLLDAEYLEKHEPVLAEEEIEPHYYGIPIEHLELFKDTGYDVSDKVIGIMAYSKNQPGAYEVLKWILRDGAKS
jgi:hypothetical protein